MSSSSTHPTAKPTTKPAATAASTGSTAGTTAGSTASSTHAQTAAHRLQALTKTTEFKWFSAHALVVLFTALTTLFWRIKTVAIPIYRFAYLASLASFGIILFQKYGKSRPSFSVLIRDGDFQYALYSLFWFLTQRRLFSLLPLAIFSLFHVLTYSRAYLLPALGHGPESHYVRRIEAFVKNYNEPLTVVAANIEFLLAIRLLIGAFTFARNSWIQLIAYVAFFRLRYATSAYTRNAVKAWEVRVDQLLGHPKVHPSAKQYWVHAKGGISRIPGPSVTPATAKTN